MQKFTSFKESSFVARVLSFVLNHPVSISTDGASWFVHSEVDFYVALSIWVDMRKYETVSWDKEGRDAYGRWREKNAGGSDGYRAMESAAFRLKQSPLMQKSELYISPEQMRRFSAEAAEEDANNEAGSYQEQTGYWNGYDWIYTKEDGDGEDWPSY